VSKRTRSDHEAIVGAIAARKPKRAHEAMAHLANVRDATLQSRHEAA
jgi:DNA-binding FadR family transcriptional regulator